MTAKTAVGCLCQSPVLYPPLSRQITSLSHSDTAVLSFCNDTMVEKPEGKRPLGRPRRRREENINMDLQEVGRGCGDWMELAKDRDGWRALVSTVMDFRVPQNVGDFLISCKTSQLLKKDSAPWSKYIYVCELRYDIYTSVRMYLIKINKHELYKVYKNFYCYPAVTNGEYIFKIQTLDFSPLLNHTRSPASLFLSSPTQCYSIQEDAALT